MENFFKKFSLDYPVDPQQLTLDVSNSGSVVQFLCKYAGASFNRGLYRILSSDNIDKWTRIVTAAFPQYKDKIFCFGYDWLGRQFALKHSDTAHVLMFDIDTGEVLEIPVGFNNFHDIELVEYGDDAVAESAFREWTANQEDPLGYSECVSFKIPLHLGGRDTLSNRERIDLQVHWELGAQVLDQLKPLKEGRRISGVRAAGSA